MTKLLHISSSPRGTASESLGLAATFIDAYRAANPDASVEQWDLWDGTLPAFGADATHAKMAKFAVAPMTSTQSRAWESIEEAFDRFDAADRYLFSVPMWNHTVPYILKQFIDVVSQPGLVFTFDPNTGYSGLLDGKKAAVLYTGAVWGPGRPVSFGEDFQQPYFESWLRWAGVDDIVSVRLQPNAATSDLDLACVAAHSEARRAAATF